MDTEALHVALQQSFSPDANLRDPAEKAIKSLKNVKGATVMLLQVVAEKQVTSTNNNVFFLKWHVWVNLNTIFYYHAK